MNDHYLSVDMIIANLKEAYPVLIKKLYLK